MTALDRLLSSQAILGGSPRYPPPHGLSDLLSRRCLVADLLLSVDEVDVLRFTFLMRRNNSFFALISSSQVSRAAQQQDEELQASGSRPLARLRYLSRTLGNFVGKLDTNLLPHFLECLAGNRPRYVLKSYFTHQSRRVLIHAKNHTLLIVDDCCGRTHQRRRLNTKFGRAVAFYSTES